MNSDKPGLRQVQPPGTVKTAYRADIDGLRAIAVISVVIFHAFPSLLKGGFTGVDVFFVISGYLITSIILAELNNDKFSFVNFYTRRVLRIFPSLIVGLLAALMIGCVVLYADEYAQLATHVAGAAAFIANFIFWSEVNYFDITAESKPLLHLWSLGVEEQFYLLHPILLYIAVRFRGGAVMAISALALISFAANIALISQSPSSAFYLPASRFWEMCLGALLACYRTGNDTPGFPGQSGARATIAANIVSFAGIACILASFVLITRESLFPGWLALLPALGTALVIAAGSNALVNRKLLSNPVLVWGGLISYPLYLWHWILLSFGFIISGRTPTSLIRAGLVGASVLLAWLTYKYFEGPLRRSERKRRTAFWLAVAMAGLFLSSALIFVSKGTLWIKDAITPMSESELNAERSRYSISDSSNFDTGAPKLVVFGDSQGFDAFFALKHAKDIGVKFILAPAACDDFDSYARNSTASAACKRSFETLLGSNELKAADTLVIAKHWVNVEMPKKGAYERGLQELRRVNPALKIVIFGQKPMLGSRFVPVNALMRYRNAAVPINVYLQSIVWAPQKPQAVAMSVAAELGAPYIDVEAIYCAGQCIFYENGKYMYFDHNHWTALGAKLFYDKLSATPLLSELFGVR